MAKFVDLSPNSVWVNLDRVARMQQARSEHGRIGLELLDDEGRPLGMILSRPSDRGRLVQHLCATIIPAAQPGFAVVIRVDDPGSRPIDADMYVQRLPIIGWRVSADAAEPIVPGTNPSLEATILIELPDGKLSDPADVTYDDLEEAKASILKLAQADWDQQQEQQRQRLTVVATPKA
jgi:hypothetical protein